MLPLLAEAPIGGAAGNRVPEQIGALQGYFHDTGTFSTRTLDREGRLGFVALLKRSLLLVKSLLPQICPSSIIGGSLHDGVRRSERKPETLRLWNTAGYLPYGGVGKVCSQRYVFTNGHLITFIQFVSYRHHDCAGVRRRMYSEFKFQPYLIVLRCITVQGAKKASGKTRIA